MDREARTLTVRTDSAAHISGRDVVLTAAEVAGEGERGRGRIQHGYATTTATAQGREWDTSHVVLTGSRLAGLEQTYTAQTRANIATHVYVDAESVHAEADPANGRSLRDATLDALAETLVRPTAKVTTLDYASPEARAALEQRFAAPVRQWQRLDDPATGAQRDLLERMQRSLPAGATWLQASVAIDAAHGHAPGTQSVRWLEEAGLGATDARRRVETALAAQQRQLAEFVGYPTAVSGDATFEGIPLAGSRRPEKARQGPAIDTSAEAHRRQEAELVRRVREHRARGRPRGPWRGI